MKEVTKLTRTGLEDFLVVPRYELEIYEKSKGIEMLMGGMEAMGKACELYPSEEDPQYNIVAMIGEMVDSSSEELSNYASQGLQAQLCKAVFRAHGQSHDGESEIFRALDLNARAYSMDLTILDTLMEKNFKGTYKWDETMPQEDKIYLGLEEAA